MHLPKVRGIVEVEDIKDVERRKETAKAWKRTVMTLHILGQILLVSLS